MPAHQGVDCRGRKLRPSGNRAISSARILLNAREETFQSQAGLGRSSTSTVDLLNEQKNDLSKVCDASRRVPSLFVLVWYGANADS